MSDESIQLNNISDAKRLIEWLLSRSAPEVSKFSNLDQLYAERINDGRMGSLRLFTQDQQQQRRRFGSKAAELNFLDSDGIPVTAALILDQDGRLFELDLFKADFGPLHDIPILEPK